MQRAAHTQAPTRQRVNPNLTPPANTSIPPTHTHAGGRAVVDAIESQLSLTQKLVEPSRAGLYRFGNISSSSIWYVLAYIESYKGLAKGERVWQLGFGSGFKCNSAVWRVNRCGGVG